MIFKITEREADNFNQGRCFETDQMTKETYEGRRLEKMNYSLSISPHPKKKINSTKFNYLVYLRNQINRSWLETKEHKNKSKLKFARHVIYYRSLQQPWKAIKQTLPLFLSVVQATVTQDEHFTISFLTFSSPPNFSQQVKKSRLLEPTLPHFKTQNQHIPQSHLPIPIFSVTKQQQFLAM